MCLFPYSNSVVGIKSESGFNLGLTYFSMRSTSQLSFNLTHLHFSPVNQIVNKWKLISKTFSKVFSTIIQRLNRDFPVGQSLETKVRSSFKLHLLRSRGLVDCNSNQVESIDEIALLGKLGCCTLENYLARVDFFWSPKGVSSQS